MFSFVLSKNREKWHFEEEPLPLTSYNFGNLILTDEDLLVKLKKAPKRNVVLEMEVSPLGASVTANPMLSGIVDASSGMAISFEMNEPEEDSLVILANSLIDFIFKYGLTREIRVSNVIVEAALEQICEICVIKLRRVKRLQYMNRLNNEYIELLSEVANPSEKFWRLDKRIKEDRKKTGVQLEMSRSNLIYNIISLINDGAISCEDLQEFSTVPFFL